MGVKQKRTLDYMDYLRQYYGDINVTLWVTRFNPFKPVSAALEGGSI
jgi:hypothetical protein